MRNVTCLFAAASLAAAATAQQLPDADAAPVGSNLVHFSAPTQPGSYLALGTLIEGPIDVNTPAGGNNGALGVEWAWNHYWVSTRGNGGSTAAPHTIYKHDSTGAVVGQFAQTSTGSWGHRDLASDEAGNKLWGGHESGTFVEYNYDPMTGNITFSSQKTIIGTSTIRALARNPMTGNFYTANFTADFVEFDPVTATAVNSPLNPGKAFYGMAWDVTSSKLWGFSQNASMPLCGTTGCDLVEIFDIDPPTGALLGTTFDGTNYGITGTNIAGGLDIRPDHPLNPGFLSAVALHQNTLDEINVYDLAVAAPGSGSYTPYCVAKVNSLGCTPTIAGSGNPSATQPSGFTVSASNVLNNRPGLFFYKVNGAQAAIAFQCGTLCLGPSGIKRTPVSLSGGNPPPAVDCSGVGSIDMNAFAQGVLMPIPGNPDPALMVQGNQYHAQMWSRDQGFPAPCNTGLTDALEVNIGM